MRKRMPGALIPSSMRRKFLMATEHASLLYYDQALGHRFRVTPQDNRRNRETKPPDYSLTAACGNSSPLTLQSIPECGGAGS